MQALFEAVRRACNANAWSRGVELVRADAVTGDHADDEEIVLKVTSQESVVSRTVTLWPADAEWSCDCPSREDACAHVAAAVIALRRARQDGQALPTSHRASARLRYCFTRAQGTLAFERLLVHNEHAQRLRHSLTDLASGHVDGPTVVTTQADLTVELVLGPYGNGRLPREVLARLLPVLARCSDVYLDGTPVKVAALPIVGIRACLEERGEGFRLFVEPDPAITEIFTNGVARCGDTLRALAETGLTAREVAELPEGRYFAAHEAVDLVTDVLPALAQRLPLEVRTQRLPQVVAEPPRIVLDVRCEDNVLTVLPTLVYGRPPSARIDAGRLVHLGGAVPRRDEQSERHLLRDLSQTLQLAPGHKARFTGSEAVQMAKRLTSWPGEIQGDGHTAFTQASPLVPRWHLTPDHFEVWFESTDVTGPGRPVPRRVRAAAVVRAWQQGESLLPLEGGGWAPLPIDWLEQCGQRVLDLLAARDATGTLPRCAWPDFARFCDDLEQPRPAELAGLQVLLEDFRGIPAAPLPADLQATLRPYQRRGVNWLVFLRQVGLGAMLADDMGLGKTVQALCAIQGRTLVVAPTSVIYHWSEEIQRFRPSIQVTVYHGPHRQLDPAADVTLTTYAILRLDAVHLARQTWDTVVLDEAHNIKNPESQVAQAAYALRAAFRLTLTGTPVENRLDELWSQLHFLNRGLLGGRQDFQTHYAKPIAEGKPGVAARLRERLRPFILRRRKREVTPELPPRTDVVLHCELSAPERAVYDAIRAATLADVVARLHATGNVLAVLEALMRLRQACCHCGLIPGQTATTSAKVTLLIDTLQEAVADGHKALVFSQWTALLDRVEPHLRRAGLLFTRLDGTTRHRERVIRRFQDEAGPPVMLVSLKAGGTGLTLTAADHVFLLDPWWNPAVEDQAADRTHRIGQTRPVLVHHLVARETVEERVVALQQRKRALANVALEEADRAATITREELLALLT